MATAPPRAGFGPEARPAAPSRSDRKAAEAAGRGGDVLGDFLNSSGGRQLRREVVRGLFEMLKRPSRLGS